MPLILAPKAPSERAYTVAQFAEAVGVSVKTVRIWLQRGYLQGIKTSPEPQGHWRIPSTEVDRYLQSQCRA